jgi:hypothetical protein
LRYPSDANFDAANTLRGVMNEAAAAHSKAIADADERQREAIARAVST